MLCDKTYLFFASNLFSLYSSQINLIAYNGLTGSIPTEVGLLTELIMLGFGKHLFPVLLVGFETKQIHSFFASNLFSLFFSHIILIDSNELTGSIPMEVSLMTTLTALGLSRNNFEGSIPSTFNSLTLLEHLFLGE